MAGDDFVNLTSLVLKNAIIAYDSRDLQQVHSCIVPISTFSVLSVLIKKSVNICT